MWINRGDPLAEMVIFTSKTGIRIVDFVSGPKENIVRIKSPVSGLILRRDLHFKGTFKLNLSILLPEDEYPPENGDYIFGDLLT